MASPNSYEDNVTPLFGKREERRFVFDPSDELAERLWGLARPSYRKEMGRRGLLLYSNASINVTRQLDGALEPRDALMERDVHKILSQKPADTQRRLARYVRGGFVRSQETDEALGVKINLRLLIDMATIKKMKDSNYIPDDELFDDGAVVAGISLPIQDVMPQDQFRHRYQDLERFVYGPDWHASKQKVGMKTPSLSLGAFATNMRFASPSSSHRSGQNKSTML